jgi:hypothetical protein
MGGACSTHAVNTSLLVTEHFVQDNDIFVLCATYFKGS